MGTNSWTQLVDNAVKLMIFNRFSSDLNISNPNDDVIFTPQQLAQRQIGEKRGKGTVEFISVWNSPVQFDWSRQNSPVGRKGLSMEYEDTNNLGEKKKIITVKAVPVIMEYKFCVWTLYLDQMKQIVESYSKWVHDYPNMRMYYAGLYEMDMYLKFGTPQDITDYNIYEKGKYFVYEFPLTVDGWVLTQILVPTVLSLVIDVFLREGKAPNYSDTLLDQYILTTN